MTGMDGNQHELDELMRVIELERANTQLLTVEQVAHFLNVDEQNVYYQIRKGVMSHYRVGRLVRISKAQLERFLADHEHRAYLSVSTAADDFSSILAAAEEGWV